MSPLVKILHDCQDGGWYSAQPLTLDITRVVLTSWCLRLGCTRVCALERNLYYRKSLRCYYTHSHFLHSVKGGLRRPWQGGDPNTADELQGTTLRKRTFGVYLACHPHGIGERWYVVATLGESGQGPQGGGRAMISFPEGLALLCCSYCNRYR